MRKKWEIPITSLREMFTCDAGAGQLFWKSPGKPIVSQTIGWGYCGIYIPSFQRVFLVHRIIWAMHHGEWPPTELDHINGVKIDNRILNLRTASRSMNCRNKSVQSNSTSGVLGVNWLKREQKWAARIWDNNKQQLHLGLFSKKSDAIAVRKAAEARFGYHANHGRSQHPEVRK